MTGLGTQLSALLAAVVVAAGGALGASEGSDGVGSSAPGQPVAVVLDAVLARDGRELVATPLRDLDAEVRLPRSAREARTNVRYFAALGHRVVVAGPLATRAAEATGVVATQVRGLDAALQAVAR